MGGAGGNEQHQKRWALSLNDGAHRLNNGNPKVKWVGRWSSANAPPFVKRRGAHSKRASNDE